jgi:hypothetical protein
MPDTLDYVRVVLKALQSFHFSNYGCDVIDEIIKDPSLDLADDLAVHIAIELSRMTAEPEEDD